MNSVILIGRLARDPNNTTTQGGMAITKFSVAVNRPTKPGEEKKADFPSIITFGKTAENCAKYLKKGSLVGIEGRIQTGSYKNKDGVTVYTTDAVADRVQFLEPKDKQGPTIPEGFEVVEDDEVPF